METRSYRLRMPSDLREQLAAEARKEHRSVHGEILHRLQLSLTPQETMIAQSHQAAAA
jgi:hypothetical protein